MKKYDYLIVGSGLFGSVFAYEMNRLGKRCLVIEKRETAGGNVLTQEIDGIHVHLFGAHIFHTDSKPIWEYICQFADFNRFTNAPIAIYKDEVYNLPFNMNTFNKMWGVKTPAQAKAIIEAQVKETGITNPANLEEQALALVGRDIYEKLIRGYTEKQWGMPATELPAFIIRRLPLRFTYDNNYFFDRYQGIPIGGYTKIIEKLLDGIEVCLNSDYLDNRKAYENIARKIIFTGMIDAYYEYEFGILGYRSLVFQHHTYPFSNYQGNAVVNFTEKSIPFTRRIEHKHFDPETANPKVTVVTEEYPAEWKKGDEPFYPINNEKNNALYQRYLERAKNDSRVLFGGRLGDYQYHDMDDTIACALALVNKLE